jgi:hypothetical protein
MPAVSVQPGQDAGKNRKRMESIFPKKLAGLSPFNPHPSRKLGLAKEGELCSIFGISRWQRHAFHDIWKLAASLP